MLSRVGKKFSKNKVNAAKISFGTILGQGISILTLPIIARIYGPEIIGHWTLLMSIAIIVNSFSDLGLLHSIMIVDEDDVNDLYKVLTTIISFFSITASIIVTLFYSFFVETEMNLLFLFIYLSFLIFTSKQIDLCYTILNRNSEYDILMKNPVINYGLFSLSAILLGLWQWGEYGYFIGHMLGQFFTVIHMKRKLPKGMFTFKHEYMLFHILKQKRFIKYQMPANILSNIKNQLPTLLIRSFWGEEILGYYAITVRLLQMPSTFLAKAIGRVFFSTSSKMRRDGKDIGKYVINNMIKGMKVGIIPMSLLIAFGDVAITIFLGDEWEIAGNFIQILTLQYFFMFLTYSVQGLPVVLEKQNYAMISVILQIFAYTIGALIGKYIFQDVYSALIIMSLFFIVLNIGYYCSFFKVMKVPVKKYLINVAVSLGLIFFISVCVRGISYLLGITNFFVI
ncbi:oligosaccharide flippase family protein [Desulfotomaculum defluvii]